MTLAAAENPSIPAATEKHRIIIDCDPGVDDAFALALAFAAEDKIDLLGITCVAGNRPVHLTEWNARRLCTMANRLDTPVFAGCPRPLVYNDNIETPVHGDDGLGDVPGIPEPRMEAQELHAVSFLIKTLMDEPEGTVTLCALGPLTNIAAAIVLEPRIVSRIRRLVFMGGAAFKVSSVRVSDLNFYFDPHGAHVVLSAGIPQIMFGLDATDQVHVTEDVLASLEECPGSMSATLARMMRVYGKGDPRLHDLCVIAYLLDPDWFTTVPAHIAIEHSSELTRGITVARVSPRKIAGYVPNTELVTTVNTKAMFQSMIERLRTL